MFRFGGSTTGVYALSAIVLTQTLDVRQALADPMTIAAPCSDDVARLTGLRTCAVVLDSATGTLSLLKQRVEDAMTKIYTQGVDASPLREGAGALPLQFGPTFCNLIPGPLNNNRTEITTSRAGRSCGVPLKIIISDRGRRIRFDASAPGAETLETGYLRGSYGAALSCFHSGLAAEITRDRKINVSDSCKAMAQELQGLDSKTDSLFATVRSGLAGQNNIADIVNCVSNGQGTTATTGPARGQSRDLGPLRQSAQHLCAARLQLESMFTQLAVCEVFARAGQAYQNVIALPASRKKHSDAILDRMVNACERCEGPRPSPTPGQEDRQSSELESLGNDCVNRCYLGNLPTFLRQRFEGYWPSNATATTSCRSLPI